MQRKILAICVALVALGALAIAPAMASAATLKDTVGTTLTTLAPGAKITAYSTGTSKLIGSGLTVECNENILTGTVDKNNGEEAQVTIEDAWFQSNLNSSGTKCKSNLGEATIKIPALTNETGGTGHWCIRNLPGSDNWELWGNSCTTATNSGTLTFVVETGGIVCKYIRTAEAGRTPESNVVRGHFTTNVGTEHKAAVLTMTNDNKAGVDEEGVTFSKEEGGILCPSTGKLSNMVFDLFTDPGTSNTYVNPATAPNPVFITNP